MHRSHTYLCLAPVALFLLDWGLTLHGQPAEYWQGDYDQVVELNLIGRWLLQWHPAAFIGFASAWLVTFVALILYLPTHFAKPLAFLLTFGHATGAGSWLVFEFGPPGWVLCVLLLAASAFLLDWTWRQADAAARRSGCA